MTSAAPSKKSTKRSAAKSPARRSRPLTFYIDECLGRTVAEGLAAAGYDVRSAVDHFAGVDDATWLAAVGRHRWVVLTKDQAIRRNPLEVDAVLNAGLRLFALTAGSLAPDDTVRLLRRRLPKIQRICQQPGPFIYNITATGLISEVTRRSLRRQRRGVRETPEG